MRILLLNYEFPPLGGGAANATYYLLKNFSAYQELTIDLITSSSDKYTEENFSANIKIYRLDIGKKNQNLLSQSPKDLLVYSWLAHKKIKELVKVNKYDLVHAFFSVPSGYLALKAGLPYIISPRGSDVPGHNPKFNKFYFFLTPLIKKVWSRARWVVPNSQDLVQEIMAIKPLENIKVIFNGVDCQKFFPLAKDNKKFIVLFVGRLHAVKGLDYLLAAWKEFSFNKNQVELWLVGDGPLKSELEGSLAQELCLKLLGRKTSEELVKIYQQADVFILPSINEGMSNTVLEAMASGLAIIATDTGGVSQLIGNGRGIIVGKKSSQEILKALEKLYSGRELLKEMKVDSRQMAESMSWDDVASKYYKIYQDIV
jgi:glycosyltransferase involved in cell wall biosynthesis